MSLLQENYLKVIKLFESHDFSSDYYSMTEIRKAFWIVMSPGELPLEARTSKGRIGKGYSRSWQVWGGHMLGLGS